MGSIPILAVMLALAVGQLAGGGTACAATAGGSQPVQTTSQADCRVTALTNGTADQLAGSACHTADISGRLVQRRPGFWIAEDVGLGSGQGAADPPPAVLRAAETPPPAGAAACVSYPLPVINGGQSRQATVVACPQPDGSWRATQYTPGLPPQVYTVPPPAAGASPNDYASPGDYQDWGPDWAGGPWFWGFAPAIVVVQRFHFFHGFNHGFAHGFAHGAAGGHGGFGGMHR
jgi:hypothetical protein